MQSNTSWKGLGDGPMHQLPTDALVDNRISTWSMGSRM